MQTSHGSFAQQCQLPYGMFPASAFITSIAVLISHPVAFW